MVIIFLIFWFFYCRNCHFFGFFGKFFDFFFFAFFAGFYLFRLAYDEELDLPGFAELVEGCFELVEVGLGEHFAVLEERGFVEGFAAVEVALE